MKRALALARKGFGMTCTNPAVGAVLVKGGKIIGKGFHKGPGMPHAEAEALKGVAPDDVKGAELYVTLEPCSHKNKRTPPCVDLLMKMGVRAVYASVKDPNPAVNGNGFKILRRGGIKVSVGLLAEEAAKLNEFYFCSILKTRPFVTLKMAMTLDGKIATETGESRWVSGTPSRKLVHKFRKKHDAVMTTADTVIADNPHLGVRMVKGRDPLRIVIDRKGRLDGTQKVFRDGNFMLFTARTNVNEKLFLRFPGKIRTGFNHIKRIMREIYASGAGSVMVEAGSVFSAALLKERLVDRCIFFIAPKIVGASGIPAVGDMDIKKIGRCLRFNDIKYGFIGKDIIFEGRPKYEKKID